MWNDKKRKAEDQVKDNEKWNEKDRRRLSEPEDNDVFEESEEDEDDAGAHPDVERRNVTDLGSVLSENIEIFIFMQCKVLKNLNWKLYILTIHNCTFLKNKFKLKELTTFLEELFLYSKKFWWGIN
jgi:hypothetical protein